MVFGKALPMITTGTEYIMKIPTVSGKNMHMMKTETGFITKTLTVLSTDTTLL